MSTSAARLAPGLHTAPAPVSMRQVGRAFTGRRGTHRVLDDVTLRIEAGEVVALLGASGCGKSTLLRLVGGLDRPSDGEITVDGRAVRGVAARTAMVFQDPRLLPWRTLAGNVAFGLAPGHDRTTARADVRAWLELVGLGDFTEHRPRQVSGGMAQRTALARALARRPGVLLLDEPFAALDALTRLRMQDLVGQVQRAAGSTVLLVTHDVDEALRLADRIVVLGPAGPAGQGSTVQHVTAVPGVRPRDLGSPASAALRTDLLDRLGVAPEGSRSS
ncbi:ABC transporter ATP-binding protein [Micromonospora sp. NPDC003816]|uniref:ABC transporter ATP-binding protein n=1 Tax=Micromonospora sp. NPDC003816 TaxID=3364224 RepID=UPI00367B941F